MKSNLCIYHGNCADGFTAAWVVRNALGEENVDLFAGQYGKPFPDIRNYKTVYLVDFSYKRPVLLEMAAILDDATMREGKIIIIDHHKTAQQDLVDLPANVECHFDMDHSGAMLTWMYFEYGLHPYQAPELRKGFALDAPALIQRVEDRDLWKFKFSDTRAVAAKMFSHEYTFENWDRMNQIYTTTAADEPYSSSMRQEFIKFLAEGEAIERKHFKDIRELLAVVQSEGIIGGHIVPIANLPYTFSSDAGQIMSEGKEFAACYWITHEGITFSLRSGEGGIDVSEIAKKYGGGGHKNAAGFSITWNQYHNRNTNDLDLCFY